MRILNLVILFLFFLFLWICPALTQEIPSKQLTSEQLQEVTRLDGSWDFTNPEGQRQRINVPGSWEKSYARKFLPHFGQGVYQLRLQLPPEAIGNYFQIYINLVGGESFLYYVNGKLLGHNGFKPHSTSRLLHFSPFLATQTQQDIRIEIRNTMLHSSGLIRPVFFGQTEQIETFQLKDKMAFNLTLGVFFFLGLFHLLLYAGFREDKAILFFAFFCLAMALFVEFYQVRNLEYFFGDIPIEWSTRVVRLGLYLVFPAFFWYSYHLTPRNLKRPYLSKRFVKAVTWFNGIFILLMLLPTALNNSLFAFWALICFALLLYNIFQLRVFFRMREIYPFVISSLVFSVSLVNDLLNGIGLLTNGNITRYGMLVFCLAQAVFLALRMKNSYQQALQLQLELKEVNQNLEGLVSSRTQEIQHKNEELHKLVLFKDEMTQMVVHDLKAPLSTLLNLPSQQIGLSENSRKSFESASKRILALVENMLQIKRNEDAELVLRCRPLPLHKLTGSVLLTVSIWAQSKKITLLNQVDAEQSVLADESLLERVLLNLCDNAIKFTPIGGQICISSQLHEQQVLFWIDDTGPGMTDEMLSQAFTKHRSFGQGQTPKSSGLGLYFCRQVIEAHGGHISIENRPEGGSRVQLTLPIASSQWQGGDLEHLEPVVSQLRQLDVFEVSDIQLLLEPLHGLTSSAIRSWLARLEIAVQEVNEEAYAQSLAEVTAPTHC